jgi:hypothetical protein
MCGSTCFGRLLAHHQEHTTALGASGFTVVEMRLEQCWLWSACCILLVELLESYDDARTCVCQTLSIPLQHDYGESYFLFNIHGSVHRSMTQ